MTESLLDKDQFKANLEKDENKIIVFRDALQSADKKLISRFENNVPADELVRQRAQFADELLLHAWNNLFNSTSKDIALVAVGGYGRGELHPKSDIDLMILLKEESHDQYKENIEEFLRLLWDIGLDVGHSVRSLQECIREAKNDITVATNLMEARLLIGPESLFEQLRIETGPDRIWPSNQFFEAKWKEQQQRHLKFDDTAYKLEPNIKEGPGGLRDIQMIGWVAKRHFGAETLHDLVEHNFLTENEYHTLIDGQNFIWRVRFALHTITKRKEERLLFDHQRNLATYLGYEDGEHNLAVENLMQDYYKAVMELGRLNEMLLQHFQEEILYADDPAEPVTINKRFQSIKGFLEVSNGNVFTRYPFALLEVFLILEQNPKLKGVRASTIRLIRDNKHLIDDEFRADIRARSLFLEIIRQPIGITHELRRMNRYGILAAYLPAFANIVGRMQYDLFHAYTVDEHTLFVVRNLRRFTVDEFSNEFPLCSKVIGQIAKPELLYLAGLFHDIAKGRGGDHSVQGEQDATDFCLQHGFSQFDTKLVAWLVRNHLIMSMTAQRKDISDPEVITEFAKLVGDQMHLDYIYLLTVADIRATNPEMWNSWKDALLKELYHSTRRALRRGLAKPIDQDELIRTMQEQARDLLKDKNISPEQISELWDGFAEEYFYRHSVDEIIWHTEAIINSDPSDIPLVLVRPEEQKGSTAIFTYGPVKEYLFALSTSVLEQLGLTIVDARIITSKNKFTLNTYLVLEENGEAIKDSYRLNEIKDTVANTLREFKSKDEIALVTRRQPRQFKHFDIPTKINFDQDENNNRTTLEIITGDHPGLLSKIGKAFLKAGVRLQNACISTVGARIEDVFYITDLENQPLQDEQQLEKLRECVLEAVENKK